MDELKIKRQKKCAKGSGGHTFTNVPGLKKQCTRCGLIIFDQSRFEEK